MTVIIAILIFGFLILAHEFGHYIFARIFKVDVVEFSVGFGPKLFSFVSKKTGIRYSLRLIFIGGYVNMSGEDEACSPRSFSAQAIWKRIIIVVAGAMVNIIIGFFCMGLVVSTSEYLGSTVIAQFDDNSVSETYGLQVGDKIEKIDNFRVNTSYSLFYEISHRGYKNINISVDRKGEKLTFENISFPTYNEDGVEFGNADFKVYALKKNFSNCVYYSFDQSFTSIKMIWESLFDLLTGRYGLKAVSGPVGAAGAISDAAKMGFGPLMMITSVIALNLGIINLLPLPVFDGGKILLLLIELVFKKRINKDVESKINSFFIFILLAFFIFITFKDVVNLL